MIRFFSKLVGGSSVAQNAFEEAKASKKESEAEVPSSAEAAVVSDDTVAVVDNDLYRYKLPPVSSQVVMPGLEAIRKKNGELTQAFLQLRSVTPKGSPPGYSSMFTMTVTNPMVKDGKPIMVKSADGTEIQKMESIEVVHPAIQRFYAHSLGPMFEKMEQVWNIFDKDVTPMTTWFSETKVPKEGTDVFGALKKKNNVLPLVDHILVGGFHHQVPKLLGDNGMQELHAQMDLLQCQVAIGHYGRVQQIHIHGKAGGEDLDIFLEMDRKCAHAYPPDLDDLQTLFPGMRLDPILFTINPDGSVAWSSCNRLLTGFLLSCVGAGPMLNQTQLTNLFRHRLVGFWQVIPRILDVSGLSKFIKTPAMEQQDALSKARDLLERCSLGGLSVQDHDIAMAALKKALMEGLTPTSKNVGKMVELLLKLLKQFGHISALTRGLYEANTALVVSSAFTGCSVDVKPTLTELLEHKPPSNLEVVGVILSHISDVVKEWPLPKAGPAVVVAPYQAVANHELDALYNTLVEKPRLSAVLTEEELAQIKRIQEKALQRNVELAALKLQDLQERTGTAAAKLKTASERHHVLPQEVASATKQLEKLTKELDEAQAKVDEARAKLQAAKATSVQEE